MGRKTKASVDANWNEYGLVQKIVPDDSLAAAKLRHPAGKAKDVVNSPAHYTQFPVEVIELTEHLDFLTGNIVKYVVRAPFKGSQLEDLKKAEWYLARLIKRIENK